MTVGNIVLDKVIEQEVVFGAKPRFAPYDMIAGLANHYAYGTVEEAKKDGYTNPKKYRVQIQIRYMEIL